MDRGGPIVLLRLVASSTGDQVLDLSGRFISLNFEDSDRKADKFTLRLDNHDLGLIDSQVFLRGNILEVSWGYDQFMTPPRRIMISGIKGFLDLTVEGRAVEVIQMNRARRSRSFSNMTRSEIATSVAAEYGFRGPAVTVDDSQVRYETVNQVAETDAQFLRRLASSEGFEFFADETGVHFHVRRFGLPPVRRFEYFSSQRGEIMNFNPTTDVLRRVGRSRVRGQNPETGEELDATGSDSNTERDNLGEVTEMSEEFSAVDPVTGAVSNPLTGTTESTTPEARGETQPPAGETQLVAVRRNLSELPAEVQIIGAPVPESDVQPEAETSDTLEARVTRTSEVPTETVSPEEAERQANARFMLQERTAVEATLKLVGDPSVTAGSIIELAGVGSVFGGKYYVTSVKSQVSSSGYTMELSIIKDGTGRYEQRILRELSGQSNIAPTPPPGELDETTGENGETTFERTDVTYVDPVTGELSDAVPTESNVGTTESGTPTGSPPAGQQLAHGARRHWPTGLSGGAH